MYTVLKYEISFYTNKVKESTILGSFDDVAEETWKCILNKDCELISVMVNFLCYPKGETSGIPKSAILFVLPPEKDDFEKFKKELEEYIDGAIETVEAKAEGEYKNHRFNMHLHICDYDGNKAFLSTQYPVSDISTCISYIQEQKKKYNSDLVYQFVLKDGDKEYCRVETKLKYIDSNFWSNIIPEMIDMCINENQDDNEELMKLKSFMEDNYEN